MKVLVTGASGFIGKYLTKELCNAKYDVIGIDRFLGDGDLVSPDVAFGVIEKHRPDIVVHLAAKAGRLFGEENPTVTVSSNTIATIYVARACAKFNSRLVYVSTSEVFGDCGQHFVGEKEEGVLPHNLYGLSKKWGEEAACLYANKGLQILRLSMPYGPGLPAGRGRAAIITFLWNAHNRKPITVHRGGRRCLCWIGDLITGMRMVVENGGTGIWSIGRQDNEASMLDVARLACSIAEAPLDLIKEIEPPSNQTIVKRLNVDRLIALSWKPQVNLYEGMRWTYESIKLYDKNGMPPLEWRPV